METMRIMTYNICHYNFDKGDQGFPPSIFDEKVANLKEMLMEYAPDIIGVQEDATYIDAPRTQKSCLYLYDPIWSFHPSTSGCTIRAKFPAIGSTHERIYFSTERHLRKVIFKVNGKRLLFISCHPTAHVGNSVARKQEFKELFGITKNENWDYCVITGDFNTTEDIDKINLKKICAENSFNMAIGTYLPWIPTYPGHNGTGKQSFDNILVSENITIKSVKVLREWYDKLYSDHVPVIADITLL